MKTIAEEQITPELLKKVTPDISRRELMTKAVAANKIKDLLDKALAMASNAIGGTFSTRVKNVDTAHRKIAQKRLQGRDYAVKDLGDMLGGRLIVNGPKDYKKGVEQIKEMEKQGIFTIKKQEKVRTGSYDAEHFDVVMPNGLRAELQLHTKQSEAESLANHQIRAEFGEKPEGIVKALRDKQANIVEDLHPDRAKALSHAIATLTKQSTNEKIPHTTMAGLVKQASI